MTQNKELTAREAKEKALRLLEYRAHSEKELCDKLLRAGANAYDLPPIMDFLKEYGFLNDSDYSKRLAQDLKNLKKFGKRRIIAELKAKGISEENIEVAKEELSDDECEALLPLVEKRLKGDFEKKSIDRAIRYFTYRGYSFSDIKECVNQLKADAFEEGDFE